MGLEFGGGSVDAAGKGDLGNVQLVLQQIIDDLDHAFHRQGLLGDHQAALRISGGQFGLESGALHLVLRGAVADPLLLVHLQDGGQKGVVLAQNQRVVKVFQNRPGGLLNLIAGENHVDAGLDGIFHLDGQHAGVAVEILGFPFESIKPVSVLQIQCGNASHRKTSLLFIEHIFQLNGCVNCNAVFCVKHTEKVGLCL